MYVLDIVVAFMVVLRPTREVQHLYVCIGHCCCFYDGIKAKDSGSAPLCVYATCRLSDSQVTPINTTKQHNHKQP